jgi:hypothetical protein
VDHQDWDDWGGDGDGDYSGDADTAELGEPDEPLASGLGGYEEPGGYPPGDGGGEQGLDPPAGSGPGGGGGFLEDDPMGALDADHGDDAGDTGDAGEHGEDVGDGEPGHAYLSDTSDPDPGDEPVDTPGPDAGYDTDEPDAAHPENVVGADPDVDPDADWSPADFPEQLDFAAPEPVDGYPWSDPSAVAAPGTGGDDPAHGPDAAPPAQDLLDYAGAEGGGDPWAALVGSDDPAASSLGRWWAPGA